MGKRIERWLLGTEGEAGNWLGGDKRTALGDDFHLVVAVMDISTCWNH